MAVSYLLNAWEKAPTEILLIYCSFHSSSMFWLDRHFCLCHRSQAAIAGGPITQGVFMSSDSSIPLDTVSLYSLR